MTEKTAKKGDKVKVHYEGTLNDGKVFDSSYLTMPDGTKKPPLEFTVGEGKVIKGFDSAVEGMKVGDKKKVTIEPKDAYGDKDPSRIQEVPLEHFKPSGIEPKEGMLLQMQNPQRPEVVLPALVTKVTDKTATIDVNHPLAGQTLNFMIELVEVADN